MEKKFNSKLYKPIIITIDGPAASGKGTIVRGLKKNLDERYKTLDAGLMYRTLTYFFLKNGIDADKLKKFNNLEKKLEDDVKISYGANQELLLNNKKISEKNLRGPDIDPFVGKFAEIDEVKLYIIELQKQIVKSDDNLGWILDGRCMGSAVAPQAQVKFYIDAPLLVRATRRHQQYERMGKTGYSTEEIAIDIERRDNKDRNTRIAPLVKPSDSFELNSYKLSANEVIDKTFLYVKRAIIKNGLL